MFKQVKIILGLKGFRIIIVGFVVLVTAVWLLLQSYFKLQTPLLRADFISTLLPGIAPFRQMGSPYLNYWEVRPPALPLMTGLWGAVFGSSLWSFHILYILFLAGIMRMSWVILSRLFSFYEKIVIYLLFGTLFFVNSVQTQFFPPEINGLFFVLAGLTFALKEKPTSRDIFLSSFLFIIASQMKEVFAFAGISLLPHLLARIFTQKKGLGQFIASVMGGVGLAGIVVLGYLFLTNALQAYGEVLRYKSQVFAPLNFRVLLVRLAPALIYLRERFLTLPYNPTWLFGGAVIALLFWIKKRIGVVSLKKYRRIFQQLVSLLFSKSAIQYVVVIFFCLGSFIGYLMQDRRNHIYDIAILLPFVISITLSGKMLGHFLFGLFPKKNQKNFSFLPTVFSFLIACLILAPNTQTFNENANQLKAYDPETHVSRWLDAESGAYAKLEKKIKNNTSEEDCIDVQHGWNVGQQYYYANRRPCTRFFLTNILPPQRKLEYQSQLVSNPPAALIYITVLTDLDVEAFNQNVFNFSKVIDACFTQDDEFPTLYWPALESDEFSECFKTGLPS